MAVAPAGSLRAVQHFAHMARLDHDGAFAQHFAGDGVDEMAALAARSRRPAAAHPPRRSSPTDSKEPARIPRYEASGWFDAKEESRIFLSSKFLRFGAQHCSIGRRMINPPASPQCIPRSPAMRSGPAIPCRINSRCRQRRAPSGLKCKNLAPARPARRASAGCRHRPGTAGCVKRGQYCLIASPKTAARPGSTA